MVTIRTGVVLLSVLPLACGDVFSPSAPEGGKAAEFQVSVQRIQWGSAGSPVYYAYNWTAGHASRVTVSRSTEPADVVWEIIDDAWGGIRSGVWHGQVPNGAVATVESEPLLLPDQGGPYRVSVTLLRDGRTRSADFTP
jgi:hypothetical protein